MNRQHQPWRGAGPPGRRDGLQGEERCVATAEQIALVNALVNALSSAGLAKIEVTSFVSPKLISQLRDAEIVLREIRHGAGAPAAGRAGGSKFQTLFFRPMAGLRRAAGACGAAFALRSGPLSGAEIAAKAHPRGRLWVNPRNQGVFAGL